MTVKERLEQLRKLMKQSGIDAYIIPSADPHQSEYVAPRWKVRAWISGFNGSAGTVVVTQTKAGLWTDGRYFLQAEEQLKGSTIKLFKAGLPETPDYKTWIIDELKKGGKIGFDSTVMSINDVDDLKTAFGKKGLIVKPGKDLVDMIWKDRPAFPSDKAVLHPLKYAGMSRPDKFKAIREKMAESEIDYHIFASLDDIAWLFNIRGSDVDCNPVVMGFGIIGKKSAELFVQPGKFNAKDIAALEKDGVKVRKYEDIFKILSKIGKGKIFIDPARCSQSLLDAVDTKKVEVVRGMNMSQIMKAVKNATEIEGMKKAHIIDGVAMVKFLHWFDTTIGKDKITEISSSDVLESIRKEGENFAGLSFETISGYGEHGAIIHYSATPESSIEVKPAGFYLIDSGAQYMTGTTDITRTVVAGKLTKKMIKDFTLVLKGHIAIATARFPQGFTSGTHLDALARTALWNNGQNYNHGTGHGVGAYLSVHEGPMGISPRWLETKLVPGMIMSNEPGYYESGQYGIRIENLVLVEQIEETAWGKFLGFRNLTMCPIDIRAIDPKIMS
ncbi:MAG TPA: aminopeptidase P family N-terminal domain-containing protein, partial [bacterium]|nr:aminopeptidase P family N-terminal domain-containing protein [bacterium]